MAICSVNIQLFSWGSSSPALL